MTTLKLLLAEILYRKVNFALSLFAITIAAALFVAGPMLVDGYQQETQAQFDRWDQQVVELETKVEELKAGMKQVEQETAAELDRLESETRRLMRDMGFNLMIVHRDTNMSDFWAADFAAHDMPQDYVDQLAADERLTLITHLVATLQSRIQWEDRKVLLVGYLPETTQSHMRKKAPMGYVVESGTVFLGHELAVGRKVGETVAVSERELKIARILPEQGSKEDITMAVHLEDAQAILGKPGSVNQIMALGCHCAGSELANIRKQLTEVLPETRITEFRSIALARAEQRDLVVAQQTQILGEMERNLEEREKILSERKEIVDAMAESRARVQRVMVTLADVITPLVVLAAAVWVGLLRLANVRERRTEIGLLRALGKSSAAIASLFLGKACVLGLLGGVAGFALGTLLAGWLGSQALDVAATHFAVRYDMLVFALVGAPVLSVVASYLPTLTALIQDPAVVLRDV